MFSIGFLTLRSSLVAGDREDWMLTTKVSDVTATKQPTANVSRRSDPGRSGFESG